MAINPRSIGLRVHPLTYMPRPRGPRRSWAKVFFAILVALGFAASSALFAVRYVVKDGEMRSLAGSFCGTDYQTRLQKIDPRPERDLSLAIFAAGAMLATGVQTIRLFYEGSDL